MNLTDIETKLAALALDKAAHQGEIDNSAAAFFRALRKRGVDLSQFKANGSSNSDSQYLGMWQTERITSSSLRIQLATAHRDLTTLRDEITRLQTELSTPHFSAPKARKQSGHLLTEKEEMLLRRLAEMTGEGSYSAWNICRNNSENGTMSGLIKKGMVSKTYSNGHRMTEAGVTYYRAYCAS